MSWWLQWELGSSVGREELQEKETEGFLLERLNLAKLSFGLRSENGWPLEEKSVCMVPKECVILAKLSQD